MGSRRGVAVAGRWNVACGCCAARAGKRDRAARIGEHGSKYCALKIAHSVNLKDNACGGRAAGIDIPKSCRIETTIENHDWLGAHAPGLASANGTIICNVGGGNIARGVYRVVSYGHDHSTIGKFKKKLLHGVDEQEVGKAKKSRK